MGKRARILVALGALVTAGGILLAVRGCGTGKSTDALIADLKSPDEKDRLIAVRLLQHKNRDAARVVPALIEALKDHDADIRHDAAVGLGYFGERARDAIPALQAAQRDRDPRVREAAGVALARIDPELGTKSKSAGKSK